MFCKSRNIMFGGLFFYIFLVILIESGSCEEIKMIKFATGEYSPYVSKELAGYGMVTEIISAVVLAMGYKPEYLFYPWKRCEAAVKHGSVWASFPYGYTEDRAKQFLYSDEFMVTTDRFFYYKKQNKKKIVWDKLEDLMPYKIGGVLGYFYEKEFKQAGLTVYYSYTEKDALKLLRLGRVDLIPLDELLGWDLIAKYYPQEIENFGVLEKAYLTSGNYLIVSKKYPNSRELLKRFNEEFKKIKGSGFVEQVFQKYKLKN